MRILLISFLIACIISSGLADRLPNQTPENQVFSVDTVIDATGQAESSADMDWTIGSPSALWDGWIEQYQAISLTRYQDTLLTNGGKLSVNKNWDFSSKDQADGIYNIETTKVLTYGSMEGSHLVGEEEFLEDNAGNWNNATDNIRCVFSSHDETLPPFCDIVTAKSRLININIAQVSTKGQIRSVASHDYIPAELNYQIAVSPDTNSGSGFAEGGVKTLYSGSIVEGRGMGQYPKQYHYVDPQYGIDTWYWGTENSPSHTNTWKDTSEALGGIKTFQKAFDYRSGFRI